ncbi:hypothetical protein [Rhodosalinus halophilus]|uniref:hypothetical protein n=1 Tax=Rhodosalinus halophilus TaxID=2259333 RepID=UPI0011BD9C9C|nr:hypothetical protein [Rhodosalinus halophilus]
MTEVIELSWRTQVVIIGGYLAYVIAYSGRRSGHSATDTIGIILCFGGLGLLSIGIAERVNEICGTAFTQSAPFVGTLAVVVPIASALLWRSFLNDFVANSIRIVTGTNEDGLPTAWTTIIQRQGLQYAQLVVTLRDGKVYESYPLGDFNDLPNGPCVLGSDGSIGMYVTYITEKDGTGRRIDTISDVDGYRITFIPFSEISEVDLRRKKRP